MQYPEPELLMLSGLQHFVFCPRQWALIHIEQQWAENVHTTLGQIMHEKVHTTIAEQRGNIRTVRSLNLVSHSLGLTGQTDAVEFHKLQSGEDGLEIDSVVGKWKLFPIEYKLGKPKSNRSDEVQLCAQAICLEEMLNVNIAEGAIFYGKQRRRTSVIFDSQLRSMTKSTAMHMHDCFDRQYTPPAVYDKKCPSCSLIETCMPKQTEKGVNVKNYIQKMVRGSL
jgi:CRISPR-associated exonuclease Cas4